MSENELTKKEKVKASQLLLSGFIAELIGGASVFLMIIVILNVEPFLAAFLIVLIEATSIMGVGLAMLWLGNPHNIYWKQAEEIYKDDKDKLPTTAATSQPSGK